MRYAATLLAPVLLSSVLGPAGAAERPVVVELFTSQSCSSCPPAEALLGRLAHEGADVLPLAFHVTYWNHLDWRDAYSLPAATARQSAYAARLRGPSYTPQAVVDGHLDVLGSDEAALRAAVARARAWRSVPVFLVRDGGGLAVKLGAASGSGSVVLVGFDPSHTTRVARGENAGRTIEQANIVRSLREIGRWSGAAMTLSTPLPAGETAAVLVQAPDGTILGAARL
ncbi:MULTISPECIES: DUF1223 domain-containing protein [Methylobacterium]|jgi:hypothetical protein|uniref:DUF1223 domain-containing protein n=1 Tax=Methylobacterium hispanicum TaxID=270350 RepID=A0AAV5A101_9HYPH|nr:MULTISPECIES: DUF1223 domain-containing protein [Methylobacterium]GAN52411.1 hypothetical protein ME121_6551 [Methylobacterium sp. ME121]MBN6824265.1 DUF1223 domain-containing protein [Methylobacterium organophilum]MBP31764.1 DUF1223 domain-containing protein [Methylobacterium sp.]MDH2314101.1 DUF1223 domain-containing protein [Methylobacterium brachiatum]OXE38179.1 DUF1223 domain-containing protein [Methylobacterium radiotolerans]